RSADKRRDTARSDLQIEHRSAADVGPPARQPIRKVAVAFEVVAPRFAPEGPGDRAAFDHNRRELAALLPELHAFARRLHPSSADRDVGDEAVIVVIHPHASDAVWRSSATSFNSWSSLISVNSTSPPPSSRFSES